MHKFFGKARVCYNPAVPKRNDPTISSSSLRSIQNTFPSKNVNNKTFSTVSSLFFKKPSSPLFKFSSSLQFRTQSATHFKSFASGKDDYASQFPLGYPTEPPAPGELEFDPSQTHFSELEEHNPERISLDYEKYNPYFALACLISAFALLYGYWEYLQHFVPIERFYAPRELPWNDLEADKGITDKIFNIRGKEPFKPRE